MTGDRWQPEDEFDFKAPESVVGKRQQSHREEEAPELEELTTERFAQNQRGPGNGTTTHACVSSH